MFEKNPFQSNKITLKICFRFRAVAFPLICSKYLRLSTMKEHRCCLNIFEVKYLVD